MSEPYTPAMAYPNGVWNSGTEVPVVPATGLRNSGWHRMPPDYYVDWLNATEPYETLMTPRGDGKSRRLVIFDLCRLQLLPEDMWQRSTPSR